jgi:hypothetical protein
MLLRMRSQTLMVRSTATPCVSNHKAHVFQLLSLTQKVLSPLKELIRP